MVDQDGEAYRAAERIADRHNSPEMQKAIAAAKQRLGPHVKRQCGRINRAAVTNQGDAVNPDRPELLIFISSSMPPAATFEFARAAYQVKDKSDVRFVLRGFPEGDLTDYLKEIRADSYSSNLTVDPLLFDTYEVKKVPAVVVNRAVRIDHPRDLKSALILTQAATDQNLNPLIRDLSW
jgi:type-F conjugative transfer system pilin assembly protein TrbC